MGPPPSTFDTIHPIDMQFGTYKAPINVIPGGGGVGIFIRHSCPRDGVF